MLRADGETKLFGLAHAQAILLHQIKAKCKSCWEIVGDDYEFNGVEINAVKRNTGSTKKKAEPGSNPTSKNSAK